MSAPPPLRSQLPVEDEGITSRGRAHAELHDPPASHVELHSLCEVIAVAEGARHLWPGGKPCPCCGMPLSTVTVALSTGVPVAVS